MSHGTAIVERLLEDSREDLLLGQSEAYADASFDDASAAAAVREVAERRDASAFHVLMALRDGAPAAHEAIPADARAAVLVDALRTQSQLNDWGYLEPGGDGYDGPAADALLDTGPAAVDRLRPLLDDDSPAEMTGSEIAEMAHRYGYRRKDFAARYLALLLGREPAFAEHAADRDRAIAELRGA
jgi:hypothetical protein